LGRIPALGANSKGKISLGIQNNGGRRLSEWARRTVSSNLAKKQGNEEKGGEKEGEQDVGSQKNTGSQGRLTQKQRFTRGEKKGPAYGLGLIEQGGGREKGCACAWPRKNEKTRMQCRTAACPHRVGTGGYGGARKEGKRTPNTKATAKRTRGGDQPLFQKKKGR